MQEELGSEGRCRETEDECVAPSPLLAREADSLVNLISVFFVGRNSDDVDDASTERCLSFVIVEDHKCNYIMDMMAADTNNPAMTSNTTPTTAGNNGWPNNREEYELGEVIGECPLLSLPCLLFLALRKAFHPELLLLLFMTYFFLVTSRRSIF